MPKIEEVTRDQTDQKQKEKEISEKQDIENKNHANIFSTDGSPSGHKSEFDNDNGISFPNKTKEKQTIV